MPRVIARVDFLGNIDTTTVSVLGNTALGASKAFSIASACTYDGTSFAFGSDYVDAPVGVLSTPNLPLSPGGYLLWAGNMRLFNYINFGQNVSDITQLKGYAAANNRSIFGGSTFPSSYYNDGGMPVCGFADFPRQCGWSPNNKLMFSRSWCKYNAVTNDYGQFSLLEMPAPALAAPH